MPKYADRPAGGWPLEGFIVMTPERPSDYYPFSVCLITASSDSGQKFLVVRAAFVQVVSGITTGI
jgi:hypothetical protein